MLTGGAPPRIRGELRLETHAGQWSGIFVLETRDSAPIPVLDVQLAGNQIDFRVPADPTLRFTGVVSGNEMAGRVLGAAAGPQEWSARRIADAIEYYPAFPRFTLRQIIAGRGDSTLVVPGPWLAAADAAGFTPAAAVADYRDIAGAADLPLLEREQLAGDGGAFLTGGSGRTEALDAVRRTLDAIHSGIPDPATRARFDGLFRGEHGGWRTDIHTMALERAALRLPGISWNSAAPALRAVGWLPSGSPPETGVVQLVLYQLAMLQATDTIAARSVLRAMHQLEPESARGVEALLAGYRDAEVWYVAAVRFFLTESWQPDGRSFEEAVREFWGSASLAVPEIRLHWFGYPQAVPRFGVPAPLFRQLVVQENWTAGEWLRRNGSARFFAIVQAMGRGRPHDTSLECDGRALPITTVYAQARTNTNGFLDPEDAILIDPSYAPVLAVGTLLHEWQHLIFERARYASGDGSPMVVTDGAVTLRPTHPYIAEGVAEWGAEMLLAPVADRYPLLGLAEGLKRARLAESDPGDPHLVGYQMVQALAEVIPDRGRLLGLLASASVDPRLVLDDPAVARAWARYARAPDRVIPIPAVQALIPETRFTIDGGLGEVLARRIIFAECESISPY